MVIEGADTGCLREVMIITSGLSVRDPRERPAEKREEAAQFHARFNEAGSDFLAWIRLWEYIETERRARSNSQFRKLCKREYLNFNRIREWQDIYRQLERTTKSFKWQINTEEADGDVVHMALLTGLLSQIGLKDANSNEFTGGRNARFLISRGSALGKKPPNWVMAGELVETNRLWAHSAARIQPEWAERAGEHINKYCYDEPEWDRDRGSAMTVERVSLYGVPLVAGRRIHYRRVDPEVARQLFIHHALIEGDWDTHHAFFEQNESVLEEVRRLGARQRRDLFVEYDVLYDFYDQRIGHKVTSGADFDKWWNKVKKSDPRKLDLRLDEIFQADETDSGESEFPETWQAGDVELEVDYEFDATSTNDGVTVNVPIALIDHIDAEAFEWNVPGLREELVTALLRSMPKAVRKPFVPIPDTVTAILPQLEESSGNLVESVRAALRMVRDEPLPADALVVDRLPDHLRPIFRVVSESGDMVVQGRNLSTLRTQLKDEVRDVLSGGEHPIVSVGQKRWTFGEIPKVLTTRAAGQEVQAYPALVDEGEIVALRLVADANAQYESMWNGTRRLLRLNVGGIARMLNDQLDNRAELAITRSPHGSKVGWVTDASDAIFSHLLEEAGGLVWNEADWDTLSANVRAGLAEAVEEVAPIAVDILIRAARLENALLGDAADSVVPARQDMLDHLGRLVYKDHLSGVGVARWSDIARYIKGIEVRLAKLSDRVTQDAQLMMKVRTLESDFEHYVDQLGMTQALFDINWQLEEFRLATFAQTVGTKEKVSEKKIRAALRSL